MNADQMKTSAGFWLRAKAFALDYLLILSYLAVIALVAQAGNLWIPNLTDWLFADRARAQFTGFLMLTLPVSLYFVFSESSSRQANWGKQKVGLVVTDADGKRIGLGRSLLRTGQKFIPWELSHTLIWDLSFAPQFSSRLVIYGFIVVYALVGLNLLSLIMSKSHQTIYDLLSKTYVIQQDV
jgi:uncharacterized RDD family membrane protein YckC